MADQIKTFTADVAPSPIVPYGERRRREPSLGLAEAGHQILQAGTILAHTVAADRDYQAQLDVQGSYKDAALFRQQALERLDQMRQSGKPIGDDFNEYLTQTGDDFRQNRATAKGQQVWDIHAANIYSDLGHTARVVDADIAGENAKNDAQARINANGLSLQKDPTQLPRVLEENSNSIMDLNVPVQVKQKLLLHMNSEAARNAAEGYIDANPYRAKEILQNQDHIMSVSLTPELRTHLMDRADTKIRGIEADQMKALADAERQWHTQNQIQMTDAIVKMHNGKLDGNGIAALAAQMDPKTGKPIITAEQADHMFNYLEREGRDGAAKDDDSVIAQWAPKVYGNIASVEDIQGLAYNRQITPSTTERWIKIVQDGTTTLKQAHSLALKSAGVQFGVLPGYEWIARPEQRQAYAQYTNWLHEEEETLRKQGKPATDLYVTGKADEGIGRFMPHTGVQAPADRQRELIEQHIPVQLKSGKWVTINPDGTFNYVSPPAQNPATPNAGAGVAPNAQFTGDTVRRNLDAEIRATFNAINATKPGPVRDALYKKYDDLTNQWNNVPK